MSETTAVTTDSQQSCGFTVDPPHGRSAPPSWSIRPVEFEGQKNQGNGADRPWRCTRSFRPTRMSRLNESTCERSRGCRRHYSFTQAMPTVAPRPTTIPRRIFELSLTHSHTVASWHWSPHCGKQK